MDALKPPAAIALCDLSAEKLNDIIESDAKTAAATRSQAATRILADMKQTNSSDRRRSGRELLAKARYGRHGV